MLARNFRLRQTGDINRVYARGRYGGAAILHVKALKSSYEHPRIAIVVGKKVSKKAVVRNQIRRQIAAQLQNLWQTLDGGYDIVVSVREDASGLTAPELAKQLTAALTKAGVIKV
jgi:ribonuclease P protein component